MRLDLDTYKEILDTITRNKSRSLLTGFGVFWGVFMLIALSGGGQGLREMLQNNFAGFATNASVIWAQPTTKAYRGFNKGREWSMDTKDIVRMRHQVPELDVISPMIFGGRRTTTRGTNTFSASTMGVTPDYAHVAAPTLYYGRYINDIDMKQERKVCVIGKQIYKNLFPEGGDPCGKTIRVDSTYYRVVGVNYSSGHAVNFGGSAEETITMPESVLRKVYNRGTAVDLMAVTGKKGVVMSTIADRMRTTLARAHSISPEDTEGVTIFNTEIMYAMLESLFQGVNFLIWLVGIGTLISGAIGVSNIMMVTVKERTGEIGIRRAIGATPKMILSQIIAESIVLTAVAGMSGILFGVGILQLVEMACTTDGMVMAHFQIDFWTAILSTMVVCALGALAGLAPAWRAMTIKPVDAMREN